MKHFIIKSNWKDIHIRAKKSTSCEYLQFQFNNNNNNNSSISSNKSVNNKNKSTAFFCLVLRFSWPHINPLPIFRKENEKKNRGRSMHGIWHASSIAMLALSLPPVPSILSVCPLYHHKRKPKLCVRCYKITRFLRIFIFTYRQMNVWTNAAHNTSMATTKPAKIPYTFFVGKQNGQINLKLKLNPNAKCRVQWGTFCFVLAPCYTLYLPDIHTCIRRYIWTYIHT